MIDLDVTIDKMRLVHVDQVTWIEERVYSSPWSRNAFINEIMDNGLASYFVALLEGNVIGYAGIWTILDEAHITNLAVHPDYQCRGVGRMLLETLVQEAGRRGAARITLEVRLSNYRAQDLYRKFGFEPRGVRPRYYKDEDALVMWLDNLQDVPQAAEGK